MRQLVAVPVKGYLKFDAGLALIRYSRRHLDQIHLVETEYRPALAEAERTFVEGLKERGDPGELWKSLHRDL